MVTKINTFRQKKITQLEERVTLFTHQHPQASK